MHSALNRLQTSFGFFTSCAFTLMGIIAFLSLLPFPAPTSKPSASITSRAIQVQKGRVHYYSSKREEYASIRFDLTADLTSLFTWNTKQVFVYITANYPTASTSSSSRSQGTDLEKGVQSELAQSVIWDTIISSPPTPWSLESLKATYFPTAKQKREQRQKNPRRKVSEKSKPKSSRAGILNLKNQKPKYQITDPSGIAARDNVTLTVNWNVQPWVGALVWSDSFLGERVGKWGRKNGRSEVFEFPGLVGEKAKSEAVKETPIAEASQAVPEGGEALVGDL